MIQLKGVRVIRVAIGIEREIWSSVYGYEGLYEISSHGRVRGLPITTQFGNQRKTYPLRILKPKRRRKKYSSYILCNNAVHTTHQIHTLVGNHFIPNPTQLPCINHDDGDKENNKVTNLEWCTYSHNTLHALDAGLNNIRKLTYEAVADIRTSLLTNVELGIKYNVNPRTISAALTRKTWKHVQ